MDDFAGVPFEAAPIRRSVLEMLETRNGIEQQSVEDFGAGHASVTPERKASAGRSDAHGNHAIEALGVVLGFLQRAKNVGQHVRARALDRKAKSG
jgi:hypothetical protein